MPINDQTLIIDKKNIIYIILIIHGIGTLLPWNMFINGNDYFKFKLTNETSEVNTSSINTLNINLYTDKTYSKEKISPYAKNFLSYVGTASKVPNIIFQALNFLIQNQCGSLDMRILASVFLQLIVFVFTVILVEIPTSVPCFFWLTMLSVVIINVFNGIYQNCLFGTVARLPSKYTNALVIGTNVSGVFSSIISIVSVLVSSDQKNSAVFYFSTAVIYLFICFFSYMYMLKNNFFVYQRALQQETQELASKTQGSIEVPEQEAEMNVTVIFDTLKIIWPQCFNILFLFIVSLSLFPAVMGNVAPSQNFLSSDLFSKVSCFLLFNSFSMFGNYAADLLPRIPAKYLWIPIVLRVVFIPLTIFCNYVPSPEFPRHLPVLIKSDIAFMFIVSLFGFTGGYFTSLSMTYAPKMVEPNLQSTAGMISSFCLMLGILLGVNLSIIFPSIVN